MLSLIGLQADSSSDELNVRSILIDCACAPQRDRQHHVSLAHGSIVRNIGKGVTRSPLLQNVKQFLNANGSQTLITLNST
jgi:hypothetical protein